MSASEAPYEAEPAPRAAVCDHCGLTVPSGLMVPGAERQFCCSGCRTAWEIIRGSGLEHYYRLPERRETPVESSGRRFEEFDHPTFRALYVTRRADGLAETRLYLEGVHCASCVWLVERVPLAVPGAIEAELNVARSLVRVAWDDARTSLGEIARFLDRLGYRPHPFRGLKADRLRHAEDRAMLVRIGVAGAIAGNVMLVALALYSGWFSGMEPAYQRYFRWVSLLLAAPAVAWPGAVFFRGAWAALRARTAHMDLPIAVALTAGFARGAVNTVTGSGPIYFDGVTLLIFLLLVGRFLQQRAQRAAVDSTELLHSLSPSVARIVEEGGAVREVPAEALLPGMTLEVRAGDTLAADGEVILGRSALDLSLLTGESRPVEVSPGEAVYAGTVNRTARLEVRIEQAGESSRVGRILREIEAASQRRAPVVELSQRLAGRFVTVILALAVVTAGIWLLLDPSAALDNAIALLVVSCPCALALATPLAVTVAVGRAARTGILIKGGGVLERLGRRPGVLYLDKTGTVTEGRTTLAAWDGPEWVKPLVLSLEKHSSHPVAVGFREAWAGVDEPEPDEVEHTPGGGVSGLVGGRRVVVGTPAFVRARLDDPDENGRGRGSISYSPVLVAVEGRLQARAGFGDRIRAETPAALARLRARGWRLRLLSGDQREVVEEVGRRLGFAPEDCRGGATPEEKRQVIEEAASRDLVVMVGDGVNDAAAIAAATVGVGVRGGAEACLAAADVFLSRSGMDGLVDLVEGSERCLRLIRGNVTFSLAYNVVGVTLAMSGVLNPLIAAILMPMSSLTVVLASWRGRTFRERAA